MASKKSPITQRYYELDSLSSAEKLKLGFILEPEFDEKQILKELEETPLSVKKNHVQSKKNKD